MKDNHNDQNRNFLTHNWVETHQDDNGTYVTRVGKGFEQLAAEHQQAQLQHHQLLQGQSTAKPRKSLFVPIAAAFLAGVLTIGGMMYSADRYNWFSSPAVVQAANEAAGQTTAGQGAGITTASASAAVSTGNISSIYNAASPAVVKIETFVQQRQSMRTRGGIWFDPSNGGQDQSQGQGSSQSDQSNLQAVGTGTGFIFDSSGYIMTNQHVVADADEVQVTLQGESTPYTAKVVGAREDMDVAILKIEKTDGTSSFPTVQLGDSDKLNIGDMVVAIGNPYGFDQTLTVGVLSAKERPIQIQDGNTVRNYEHLLQTDASINPGNSGGPLLNADGQVIGMNTAGESEAQGIGFAIPSSTMKSVIQELLQTSSGMNTNTNL
ncbi:peptidase S1 and S6 chymotrypsin/Hap [Paenibacillus curdlanolyticus YK9]|uniref:Peptidase S1 and S6 chymotrypsin/Hap n=1 Tax=Paenibacillus curdlanolyticus YK9 TaxID=717606 RepID=E0IFA9_9BACL|nr:trypsin-like peptidase domain-containing protein [Paenibacillus curdlanolyticus]EFM08885.1 peptidase S1 and S6 chymotrypsin/Hap [Paenibacillus curdlanolyticus YK9]